MVNTVYIESGYSPREIRNKGLRELINGVCDAETLLNGSEFFEPQTVMRLATELQGYRSSLAQLYARELGIHLATKICGGLVAFEPRMVIDLKGMLRKYNSPPAQECVQRLDDLRYVVEVSLGTVEGLVEFHPERVRSLLQELEPYTDRSQEIKKLKSGLIVQYDKNAAQAHTPT